MKGGIVGAEFADIGQHRGFQGRKTIADPKNYGVACRWLAFTVMQNDFAALFGVTVEHGRIAQGVCQGFIEQLRQSGGNQRVIVEHRSPTFTKFSLPGGSFGGLQAVFALHLHEDAILLHGIEQAGELLAELSAAGDQIFTEQIGQVFRFGTNSEVGPVLPGQFVDQKNQGADPAAQ